MCSFMLQASPKILTMPDIHAYFGTKRLVRNLIKMNMHNILCIKFLWEIILRKKKMDITFPEKCQLTEPKLCQASQKNRLVSTASNLYVHSTMTQLCKSYFMTNISRLCWAQTCLVIQFLWSNLATLSLNKTARWKIIWHSFNEFVLSYIFVALFKWFLKRLFRPVLYCQLQI